MTQDNVTPIKKAPAKKKAAPKAAPKVAAPKKPAPKKPMDRLPKGEAVRIEDTPGWDLLISFSEVPVWDQMPLIQMLSKATEESKEISNEEYAKMTPEERKAYQEDPSNVRSFDMNVIGDLTKKLRDFAVDEDAYTKFCSGSGAMQRSMDLAMAWVGQMGEAESSEDS